MACTKLKKYIALDSPELTTGSVPVIMITPNLLPWLQDN